MTGGLCQICHENEVDSEEVICMSCKETVNWDNLIEELEHYEADMLEFNHKGETCWLDTRFCQEGLCKGCQVYVDWKEGHK